MDCRNNSTGMSLMRFAYPADWDGQLEQLYQLVQHLDVRFDNYELDYAAAIDELGSVAFDVRSYSRHDYDYWQSILSDVRLSYGWIGPSVSSLVRESHEELRQLIHQLPWDDHTAMQHHRREIGRASQTIRAKLCCPAGTIAAWTDLRDSVFDHSNFSTTCRRRDLFVTAVALRGFNVQPLRSPICEIGDVIADSASSIRILCQASATALPSYSPDSESGLAGLSRKERLDVIDRFISADLQEPKSVVWLVYKHALMGDFEQTAGPVTLFRGDWFLEVINTDRAPRAHELAPEISQFGREIQRMLEQEGSRDGIAVARVDIGRKKRSSAESTARSVTDAILAASLGVTKRPGWNYTGSSLIIEDQTTAVSSWQRQNDDLAQFWDEEPPVDLAPAREWIEHGPRRSLSVDDDLMWTLDAIAGLSSSNPASPSARLTLAVQAIERVNATSVDSANWIDFSKEFLRDWWVSEEISWGLRNAVAQAASREALFLPGYSAESLEARKATIDMFSSRLRGKERGAALVKNGIALLNTLEPDSYRHSQLKWQLRACSQSKATSVVNTTRGHFDHMIARCRSYRNASVHGSAQSPDIVTWCAGFASRMAGRALSWKLVGHLRGVAGPDTINQLAQIERWRCQKIAEGNIAESFGSPPVHLLVQ